MNFKKRSYIMFALILPLAFNCKKDDPAPSIVGKWLLTSTINSACDIPSDNGTVACTSSCFTFEFKSDNSLIITVPGIGSASGTYSVSGSNVTITLSGGTPATNPFTLTSTTLTVSGFPNSIRSNPNAPDGVDDCTAAYSFTRQ